MNLQRLTRPNGPWLHLLVAAPAEVSNALRALERNAPVPLAARLVRGRQSTTVAGFFDECAAALQFPYDFGHNWDALRDCLLDLAWLRADAVVLLVADAAHLLADAPAEGVQCLLQVLDDIPRQRNQPPRPQRPRPWHLLLHAVPEEEAVLRQRWQALGLSLHRLT
jgi:hypothetical protein